MAKKEKLFFQLTVLTVAVISALLFFLQPKNRQVNFCRKIFNGLVSGSYGAAEFIDWENLNAMGVDVSETYAQLPDEKEKQNYKKAFINGFSTGFRQIKGRPKAFINWRIYYRDSEKTVVAADYSGQNKTLLFTLPISGRPRLVAIQWEEL